MKIFQNFLGLNSIPKEVPRPAATSQSGFLLQMWINPLTYWHPEVTHENVPQSYFNRGSQQAGCHFKFKIFPTFSPSRCNSSTLTIIQKTFLNVFFREKTLWSFFYEYPPHQQRIMFCNCQRNQLLKPIYQSYQVLTVVYQYVWVACGF